MLIFQKETSKCGVCEIYSSLFFLLELPQDFEMIHKIFHFQTVKIIAKPSDTESSNKCQHLYIALYFPKHFTTH